MTEVVKIDIKNEKSEFRFSFLFFIVSAAVGLVIGFLPIKAIAFLCAIVASPKAIFHGVTISTLLLPGKYKNFFQIFIFVMLISLGALIILDGYNINRISPSFFLNFWFVAVLVFIGFFSHQFSYIQDSINIEVPIRSYLVSIVLFLVICGAIQSGCASSDDYDMVCGDSVSVPESVSHANHSVQFIIYSIVSALGLYVGDLRRRLK